MPFQMIPGASCYYFMQYLLQYSNQTKPDSQKDRGKCNKRTEDMQTPRVWDYFFGGEGLFIQGGAKAGL